jgi:hypothetical protein
MSSALQHVFRYAVSAYGRDSIQIKHHMDNWLQNLPKAERDRVGHLIYTEDADGQVLSVESIATVAQQGGQNV